MRRIYDVKSRNHFHTESTVTSRSRAVRTGTSARRLSMGTMHRRMLALIILVAMTALVLLGGSIRAFASSQSSRTPMHKYYTSIQVEKGDSLWSIADDYVIDGVQSREDFIDEVCALNHISRQDILQRGDHLVVMYYSDEVK